MKSIDDSRFIGHGLNSLATYYEQIITMIEYKMDESPGTVTVGYVCTIATQFTFPTLIQFSIWTSIEYSEFQLEY